MNEKELYIRADIFHIKLITESDIIRQYIIDNISEFERLTISFELEEKCDKVDTILQYNNKEYYNFMCTESGYLFECHIRHRSFGLTRTSTISMNLPATT